MKDKEKTDNYAHFQIKGHVEMHEANIAISKCGNINLRRRTKGYLGQGCFKAERAACVVIGGVVVAGVILDKNGPDELSKHRRHPIQCLIVAIYRWKAEHSKCTGKEAQKQSVESEV